VSESTAVNTLLCYFLRHESAHATLPEPASARDAAMLLARVANKRLGAGLDPVDVERLWAVHRERELKARDE
jgi:hypothetical protein